MYKAILFDLDGTLLPLNEKEYTMGYFKALLKKINNYDPNRLINVILGGTKKMYENNGLKTNEEVFWDYAYENIPELRNDRKKFDEFYMNEFKETKVYCKENPYIKEIIDYCKKSFDYVILATNPIFPKQATLTRMSFIGLKESDFDYISYYENSYYTKPNIKYYEDILNKFNLSAKDILFFGNNELEDGILYEKMNVNVYMVGDYVINHNKHIKHIELKDLLDTIKKEQEEK